MTRTHRRQRFAVMVGQRIRDIRKCQGLSTLELSQLMGDSRQSVERIERGLMCPTLETVYRFAMALHVPMDVVLGSVCAEQRRQLDPERLAAFHHNVAHLSEAVDELNGLYKGQAEPRIWMEPSG